MIVRGIEYISESFRVKRVVGQGQFMSFDVELRSPLEVQTAINRYAESTFRKIFLIGTGGFIEIKTCEREGSYCIGSAEHIKGKHLD